MDATLKNKNLKQKILEASRSIRKKYLQLKLDRSENDETINQLIKPITEPLQKIQMNLIKNKEEQPFRQLKKEIEIKKENTPIKLEDYTPHSNSFLDQYYQHRRRQTLPANLFNLSTPTKSSTHHLTPSKAVSFLNEENIGEIDTTKGGLDNEEEEEEEDAVFKNDGDNIDEIEEGIYFSQYPTIAQNYIRKFVQGDSQTIDRSNYGLRHDKIIDKWQLGKSVVDFNEDGNIILDKKHAFKGTNGLYELLFYKNPKNYTDEDKENYKKIIKYSKLFSDSSPSSASYHTKHRFILKNVRSPKLKKSLSSIRTKSDSLLYKKRGGGGAEKEHGERLKTINNKLEYRYWDDINELVDRLRLLLSSTSVGNHAHNNEIISILEELNENGIIRMNSSSL